jgi:hypothetical protein
MHDPEELIEWLKALPSGSKVGLSTGSIEATKTSECFGLDDFDPYEERVVTLRVEARVKQGISRSKLELHLARRVVEILSGRYETSGVVSLSEYVQVDDVDFEFADFPEDESDD